MIYCIECESIVPIEYEVDNDCHVQFSDMYSGFLCGGPFTYSEPPNVPLQNVTNLVVPDDEFMAISDANAESLLLEFENG